MKLATLVSLPALVAVCIPLAASAATTAPTDTINWLVLFFAFTTFYSEGLAAIPAIKANAIYQQIGQLLSVITMLLRSR